MPTLLFYTNLILPPTPHPTPDTRLGKSNARECNVYRITSLWNFIELFLPASLSSGISSKVEFGEALLLLFVFIIFRFSPAAIKLLLLLLLLWCVSAKIFRSIIDISPDEVGISFFYSIKFDSENSFWMRHAIKGNLQLHFFSAKKHRIYIGRKQFYRFFSFNLTT